MQIAWTLRRVFLMAASGIVIVGVVNTLRAQAPATDTTRPAFDVGSVKPNMSSAVASARFPMGPGDAYVPGSLFSATNQPLIVYLRFAYKLGQSDLLGLPAKQTKPVFNLVLAKAGKSRAAASGAFRERIVLDRIHATTSNCGTV
jgi:hypothetical protein